MPRKSPIRHKVSSYKRKDGTKVGSHDRGKGIRIQKRRKKVIGKVDDKVVLTKPKGFTVNFTYSKKPGDGESVIVVVGGLGTTLGEAYELALDEAYEEKTDPRPPTDIELVDPDLGAILQFIGRGARRASGLSLRGIRKAGKLGAKYAIKGGHVAKQASIRTAKATAKATAAVLKGSGRMVLYEAQKRRVQLLIKDSYSDNKIKRQAARYSLKRYYPDVYDICSFSKDRREVVTKKKRRKEAKPIKRYGVSSYGTKEEAEGWMRRIEKNIPEFKGRLKVKQAKQPHLLALPWMVTDK